MGDKSNGLQREIRLQTANEPDNKIEGLKAQAKNKLKTIISF